MILWKSQPGAAPLKALDPIVAKIAPMTTICNTIADIFTCDVISIISDHSLGCPGLGILHFQPCSILQSLVHPSPSIELLSSHSSVPLTMPSPQISVQVSFPVKDPPSHMNPGSFMQLLEHPSPFCVFPSSHSSDMDLISFPQTSSQVSTDVVEPPFQAYPGSISQLIEHPSPAMRFPSSHSSAGTLRESPHSARHTVAGALFTSVVQSKPTSRLHVESQPSPESELPSSHCSVDIRMPSPHLIEHTLGVVPSGLVH